MKERKTVTKALAKQYRRSRKAEKGRILEQFVEATGYDRHYAAWRLRGHGKRVAFKPTVVFAGDVGQRSRPRCRRTYGPEVFQALKKI